MTVFMISTFCLVYTHAIEICRINGFIYKLKQLITNNDYEMYMFLLHFRTYFTLNFSKKFKK